MRNLSLLFSFLIFSATLRAQSPAVAGRTRISISSDKFTEFNPTISADGKTLIFESNKNKVNNKPDEDEHWELFESRLDEKGNWSEPYPLTAINEKCNFLAGPSLSYDGNSIYFTAFIEGITTSEEIFYSTRLDDKTWGPPVNIGAPINTDAYEGFPSISANGNSLYFLRVNEQNPYDKKNKEDCFSIYVSHKNSDGTWGEPIVLPPLINSGCERDPKIMADNHTLIFSSIRTGNKGKFDMYQTQLQQDGSWSIPIPLDFINSEDNDQSPCIAAAGDVMFFYSNKDIYSIGVPAEYRQMINISVFGNVRAVDSKAPLASTIRVINKLTNETVGTFLSNPSNGSYSLVLNSRKQYQIEFSNKSYFTSVADFDFSRQESYKEIKHDVDLASDYTLKLVIKDKDLDYALNSFLSIKDNKGGIIYNDSVRSFEFPLSFKLNGTLEYSVSVQAVNHAPINQTLTFDAAFFGPEMPYPILLEHEKVSFVADVTDVNTKQKMRTKVYYNNEDKDEVIVAEAGETVYLRKGDRYQVVTSSDKGYMFSSTTIVAGAVTNETQANNVMLHVTPVKEGAYLTLNHITFPTNSAELNHTSFLELDRVTDLLANNTNISIEISAHTDDVGDDHYNHGLSQKRAHSVLEYLKKKKISTDRLIVKGYGETKPLVPNDSDANRQLNRRVELIILKVE